VSPPYLPVGGLTYAQGPHVTYGGLSTGSACLSFGRDAEFNLNRSRLLVSEKGLNLIVRYRDDNKAETV